MGFISQSLYSRSVKLRDVKPHSDEEPWGDCRTKQHIHTTTVLSHLMIPASTPLPLLLQSQGEKACNVALYWALNTTNTRQSISGSSFRGPEE